MHLNSVDLFTGIGGFTLAFAGACKPLLYCDVNPMIRGALKDMIHSKKLPTAEVVDDVRNVQEIVKIVGKREVHVLTASWPCIGWSFAGHREGFNNVHSSLFFDTVKVIEKLSPLIVMFENVPRILTANGGKDFHTVINAMSSIGYSCRWTTCSANEVGFPQIRSRWFCVCVKDNAIVPPIKLNILQRNKKAPVLLKTRANDYADRYFMLGNSIVPLVAQLAFARMYTGFKITTLQQLLACTELKFEHSIHTKENAPNSSTGHHGYTYARSKIKNVCIHTACISDYNIVLDPNNYAPKDVVRLKLDHRSDPITRPITIKQWPTPRATAPRHSNSLTERNIRDLPTAALFARKVNNSIMPRAKKGQTINPRFLEWLMGYPIDYTKVTASE